MKTNTKCIFLFLFLVYLQINYARPFRVDQIPNGAKFNCSSCHVDPNGGGPRNKFGQTVEAHYLDDQGNVKWSPALALEDSDGDGVSNGTELQDPSGNWKIGNSAPGILSKVTNPGDPGSFTDVADLNLPVQFALEDNYPNPFNPSTSIKYSVASTAKVTLKIYDVLGREVETLIDEVLQPGVYNSTFNIQNSSLSSGVYIYALMSNGFYQSKKMIFLK